LIVILSHRYLIITVRGKVLANIRLMRKAAVLNNGSYVVLRVEAGSNEQVG
jgi:hypothetical protein